MRGPRRASPFFVPEAKFVDPSDVEETCGSEVSKVSRLHEESIDVAEGAKARRVSLSYRGPDSLDSPSNSFDAGQQGAFDPLASQELAALCARGSELPLSPSQQQVGFPGANPARLQTHSRVKQDAGRELWRLVFQKHRESADLMQPKSYRKGSMVVPLEGFLLKQSHSEGGEWHQRWFEIRDTSLVYWKQQPTLRHAGSENPVLNEGAAPRAELAEAVPPPDTVMDIRRAKRVHIEQGSMVSGGRTPRQDRPSEQCVCMRARAYDFVFRLLFFLNAIPCVVPPPRWLSNSQVAIFGLRRLTKQRRGCGDAP